MTLKRPRICDCIVLTEMNGSLKLASTSGSSARPMCTHRAARKARSLTSKFEWV
jgi:hypothetical protein